MSCDVALNVCTWPSSTKKPLVSSRIILPFSCMLNLAHLHRRLMLVRSAHAQTCAGFSICKVSISFKLDSPHLSKVLASFNGEARGESYWYICIKHTRAYGW